MKDEKIRRPCKLPIDLKVKGFDFDPLILFNGSLRAEGTVTVTFKLPFDSAKKSPLTTQVSSTPLKDLSDRKLNALIEYFLEDAIYMDGEISRSQMPARMRQLRQEFRSKAPQDQVELWARFQKEGEPWRQMTHWDSM